MIGLQQLRYDDTVFENFGNRDISKQAETGMTNPMFDAFDTDSIQLQEQNPTIDENRSTSDGASIKSEKVNVTYKVKISSTNPVCTKDYSQ